MCPRYDFLSKYVSELIADKIIKFQAKLPNSGHMSPCNMYTIDN